MNASTSQPRRAALPRANGLVVAAIELVKQAGSGWINDNAFRFSASLAYYTVVSLAPLVVITVGVLGAIFGAGGRDQFLGQVQGLVGEEGAQAVRLVLDNARSASAGIVASMLGVIAFFAGYLGVFFELQAGLNNMWRLSPRPNLGVAATIRKLLLSFGMLAVFGFLLLVSLFVTAGLAALNQAMTSWQPELLVLWQLVNIAVSFAAFTFMFAFIFKYVPDVRIDWNDVWIGAASTALLFMIGKEMIGLYLGKSGIASSYGAAGSVVVLLLWVYYSALILFFGAEITKEFAERFGSKIRADETAVKADA